MTWAETVAALYVVADSGAMSAAVTASVTLAVLVGTVASVRVLAPGAGWVSSLAATTRRGQMQLGPVARAAAAAASSVLAVVSVWWLVARGHAPAAQELLIPIAWMGLALAAAASAARKLRALGRQDLVPVRRIPHLLGTAVLGEVLVAGSIAAIAWAMSHTAGVLISPAEALAAVLIARALTFVPRVPAGLLLADVTLLLALRSIGAPAAAAVAAVLLWRLAVTAAALAARAASVLPAAATPLPAAGPGTSKPGDRVHRAAFRLLGALPVPAARALRRTTFDALFSLGEDPWDYDTSSYERSKRENLVAAVPHDAEVVLEIGCAEGHNLRALAESRPGIRLIGVDVSSKAVQAARHRARLANIPMTVLQADAAESGAQLRAIGVRAIDALVVAETLYYLGGEARVRLALAGLEGLLSPGAAVVMLHPSDEADGLHAAAMHATGAHLQARSRIDDPLRPYTIDVARVPTR